MIFKRKEDFAIKEVFKAFKNWDYSSKVYDGKVYWEVNFKEIDEAINLNILKERIYNLKFEPEVEIGKANTATFYGLYNIEDIRKELEIADFSKN